MRTVAVSVDALRADHLMQYGYHRDTLPALDSVIKDGTQYMNVYANGSFTKTSVPSFLTSRLDGATYIDGGKTVANYLSAKGVKTAAFHSNTLLNNEFGELPGFDTFVNFEDEDHWENEKSPLQQLHGQVIDSVGRYLSDSKLAQSVHDRIIPNSIKQNPTPYVNAETVTKQALEWIERHASDDFFVWIHYMEPHRPYGYSVDNHQFTEHSLSDPEVINLMSKAGMHPEKVSSNEHQLLLDLYDSDIYSLSDSISNLLSTLKQLEIWESSNFYFFADHGEEFGEHDMYFHKNSPYPELLRVPLIIKRSNEETQPSKMSNRTQLLDLLPTVLDDFGLRAPEKIHGRTIDNHSRDTIVATGDRDNPTVTVMSHDHALFKSQDSKVELYKIDEKGSLTGSLDPLDHDQTVENLWERVPSVVTEMEEGVRFSEQDQGQESENSARKRLEDLGYLE